MNVLEFGNKSHKKLILINGFQMPYQIWDQYIDHYKKDYHVLVPIIPGHDPDRAEDFISFPKTAKGFENHFISRFGSKVFAIFAMSMGGVLAATLWQNGNLNIEKVIFDGSPLVPTNHFIGKMMLNFYLNITHKTQQRDEKTLEQAKNIYPQDGIDDFLKVLDAMTDTTIHNCVKGVVNYQLPANLDDQNTSIYYFHGTKFNELIAKRSAKFISKHYKNSIIKCFQGKSHCENTLFFPQLMLQELDKILT